MNEFDLVSDVSKLVFDGKVKLITKSGDHELDKSTKQMFIALKRAKLPSGQLKWDKFRKIYPDAECETLARIIPEDSAPESDNQAEEFKVLKFTDRHDDVVNSFKEQFNDSTLARFKFLVIVGESRTGKTVFAENMYDNPFIMNSGWNFGTYDANVHDCIVCNDIHDIATKVREYRTLFQSSGTTALGESRTNCYQKDVNTLKRLIIITMNREGQWKLLKNMP